MIKKVGTDRRQETSDLVRIGNLLMLLVLLIVQGGCEKPAERGEIPKQKGDTFEVIVAAGDSLTAGQGVSEEESYPAQLEKRLQSEGLSYKVINAGSSGETSSGLLSRLDWILSLKPDIIILETGANDGLRGIDPALTKRNITEILRRLHEKNIPVILAGMQMFKNLGPDYAKAFNRIYPEIATEFGVIFMPFFLEGVATNPALNISDGIHPNPRGYRVIVNNLYPFVKQAIDLRRKQAASALDTTLGQRYAKHCKLIGGVVLGTLMVLAPDTLR